MDDKECNLLMESLVEFGDIVSEYIEPEHKSHGVYVMALATERQTNRQLNAIEDLVRAIYTLKDAVLALEAKSR